MRGPVATALGLALLLVAGSSLPPPPGAAASGFKVQSSQQTTKKKSAKRPQRPPKKPAEKPAPEPTTPATPEEIDARRQELEALKRDLERERAQAEALRGQERKALSEAESAGEKLSVTRRYLKKLAEQESAIHRRLGQLELDISARESELNQVRARLGHRLREIYKTGNPGMVEVVFSSASLPDLIDRVRVMTVLADEETRLMQKIDKTRSDLHADRGEATRRFNEVQQVEREKQKEELRISGVKQEREGEAANLRKERAAHEAAAKQLQQAQESLAALIRRLETQRKKEPEFVPPSGPFAQSRGRLPWPARGEVLEDFGQHTNPKFGTSTQNNGIDIGAAAGASVRATADGKVDYSDWLSGYGNCVILNHGSGYYTLYAHLAGLQVSTDQEISAGDILGTVGNTGSLKGTMLHFEVRKGSQALDPQSWLTH
jgi:murein hydrolase activator